MFKYLLKTFSSPETLASFAFEIVEAILADPKKVAVFEAILVQIRDGINAALASKQA